MKQVTKTHQGEVGNSPCMGVTPDAFPENEMSRSRECLQAGVSTHYAQMKGDSVGVSRDEHSQPLAPTVRRQVIQEPHWFVLRTTYGREKLASDYIMEHGGTVFYPTIRTTKLVDGKRKHLEVSRLPNLFFAHGTEQEIQTFVFDNVNLPFLRFYYKHTHSGSSARREPLIVPDDQIMTFRIICEAEANHDVILLEEEIQKFKTGEKVRVIEGDFKGAVGVVARYRGQQRVGIVLEGIMTAITAYIPNAFLEKL